MPMYARDEMNTLVIAIVNHHRESGESDLRAVRDHFISLTDDEVDQILREGKYIPNDDD